MFDMSNQKNTWLETQVKKDGAEPVYTLSLTRDQLVALQAATELAARVGIGQFWAVLEAVQFNTKGFPGFKDEDYWTLRDHLDNFSARLTKLNPGASWSITNKEAVSVEARRAWDAHQVIRHFLSWEEHPEGGMSVSFFTPLNVTDEALPKLEKK